MLSSDRSPSEPAFLISLRQELEKALADYEMGFITTEECYSSCFYSASHLNEKMRRKGEHAERVLVWQFWWDFSEEYFEQEEWQLGFKVPCLLDLADALLWLERHEEALVKLDQAIALIIQAQKMEGHWHLLLRTAYNRRAFALSQLTRPEDSLESLQLAFRYFGHDSSPFEMISLLEKIAAQHRALDQTTEAKEALERAQMLLERMSSKLPAWTETLHSALQDVNAAYEKKHGPHRDEMALTAWHDAMMYDLQKYEVLYREGKMDLEKLLESGKGMFEKIIASAQEMLDEVQQARAKALWEAWQEKVSKRLE